MDTRVRLGRQQARPRGSQLWRPEIPQGTQALATEYQYTDWQGETDPYCKFSIIENFILGYWAFIQRDVYRGWTEHTGSAADYIDYLIKCGYTSSSTYQHEVLSLVPKAAVLLA